jgi:hypothetical protein
MRTVCICTLLAALIVGGCATGKGESYAKVGFNFAELEKVAILEVSGAVAGEAVKNQIGTFFEMELIKRGYTPVERAQVQALLKEQEFQASDITSDTGAAEAGKILNVPAVMLISIPTYKEQMNMTAKMIDTEDGSILWVGSGSGSTGQTLSTILGAAVGVGVGVAAAGGDSSDRAIGGIAGGVLGGVAGHALSPQQAEQVQKVIKKVCENLPSRVPGEQLKL